MCKCACTGWYNVCVLCNVQYELAWDYIFFWNIPRLCRSIQEFMKSTNFLALNRFSIYDNWMPLRIFFSLSYKAIYWIDITFVKATETERIYENVLFATFTALHDFSLCVSVCRREKEKLAVIFHVTVQSFCSCWLCKKRGKSN